MSELPSNRLTTRTVPLHTIKKEQFKYPARSDGAIFTRIEGQIESICPDRKSAPVVRNGVDGNSLEYLGIDLTVLVIAA